MNFKVEPENIAGFGKLVGRAADDMRKAMSYLGDNTELGFQAFGPVWDVLYGSHDQAVSHAKAALKGFTEVLDASEKELKSSARYYRETDHKQAAKLDQTYRGPSGPREWDESETDIGTVDPSDFSDSTSPTDHLKPTDVDENYFQEWGGEFMLNPVAKIGGTIMDFGSPTAFVTECLKFAGVVDAFEKPTQWFGGDWEGYMKASAAWENLGSFCVSIAENIEDGNRTLDESWYGVSAEVAWRYFHELAQKLRKAAESFNSLKDQYVQIARMVYAFAEAVKGFIVGLCDQAVQAVFFNIAAVAALASVAESPAAPALEALSMQRVFAALRSYTEMLAVLEKVAGGCNALVGAVFGLSASLFDEVKNFPRPGAGYDNQAV
ncbi:hypothetical protein [Streptomyces sp. NPDC048650]|uniref:hypothetical protein n=1 Tax=Streptomyces sp. NPDC048650 TaxID=3365583 RepID=UPI00371795C2